MTREVGCLICIYDSWGINSSCPEAFGLQGPEAYAYTSMSNCLEVQDIDDVKDYADTIVSDGSVVLLRF